MTSLVTKYAAKKLLGKQMEKYKKKDAVKYDPFFVMIEHPKKKGKFKKVKKQIPDYIPEHDAAILAKMRQRAYWLDCSLFNLFGIRFGWSSIIGLIPGFGDVIDCLLALLLVMRCNKVHCGLDGVRSRMCFNIVLDFLVGLIPFIGDLGDAYFRANSRNVRLLEEKLDSVYKPEAETIKDAQRPKTKDDEILPATVYEDFSDEEVERRSTTRHGTPDALNVHRPEPARVPTETRGGERGAPQKAKAWRAGSQRGRQPDLEMGRSPAQKSSHR